MAKRNSRHTAKGFFPGEGHGPVRSPCVGDGRGSGRALSFAGKWGIQAEHGEMRSRSSLKVTLFIRYRRKKIKFSFCRNRRRQPPDTGHHVPRPPSITTHGHGPQRLRRLFGRLFLPDPTPELCVAASYSLGDDVKTMWSSPRAWGLAGWIIRNQNPLLVGNFDRARFLGYYDPKTRPASGPSWAVP
jgi:hypothetical protein